MDGVVTETVLNHEDKRTVACYPVTDGLVEKIHRVCTLFLSKNHLPWFREGFHRMIGMSPPMVKVYQSIIKVLENDATVLIQGETGTGKELVADAIHSCSDRCDQPFIKVNCASIPDTLIESELFGYERGAYTGAIRKKPGKFLLAQSGSIFLDEIGELGLDLQTKLLRVIETKELDYVGGTKTIPLDVRIIAATNVDLYRACKSGQFRQDLYYRLNVVPIRVPPLRKRRQDIPLLVAYFLDVYNRELKIPVNGITPGAIDILVKQEWFGNVRELENLLKRVIIMHQGERITSYHINKEIDHKKGNKKVLLLNQPMDDSGNGMMFKQVIEEVEKVLIRSVLEDTGWKIFPASRRLGIVRNTLKKKMKQYGLSKPE